MIHTWPFWTGGTHLHPVLDHHQYKDCLDDAQRPSYLQQELCYSQRSWRELQTSSKKERRNKHCFTTKDKKSFLSFNPETVRMKPLPSDKEKLWRKGSVVKQVAPRSYEVDLQGTMFRRNRRHLVKTKEPSPQLELDLDLLDVIFVSLNSDFR